MRKVAMNCKISEIYSVEAGDYVGQMLVVVSVDTDTVGCLTLPHMKNLDIPRESFDNGRNTDIIKFVEKLPKHVFKISKAQYTHNENTDNRFEQSHSPNMVDC